MYGQPRVALITGGTGGLGVAVTATFLEAGARVMVTYRSQPAMDELRRTLGEGEERLAGARVDVTDEAQVQRLVQETLERFGRIDALVNLVGGYMTGRVAETSLEAWRAAFDLNLTSTFLVCRAVVPTLLQQGSGRIVNTSTRAALKGSAAHAPYAASKAGVIVLTQSLDEEVKDHGGAANCVLPSVIDTPANRASMPKADFSKWVKPRELARVILFLTSDAASAIHGAAIPVYGRA